VRVEAEVRSLQDLMRRDPGLDGDAQRLEQLVWLILLRVCTAQNTPLPLQGLPEPLRWEDWTERLPQDADLVPAWVEDNVLAPVRALQQGSGAELARLLRPIRNHMSNGELLRQLIGRIGLWSLASTAEVHQIGRLYEHLVSVIGGAGNAGEFYTPRSLTNLLAELVELRQGDSVFDPAAGTCGMLISALGIAEHQGFGIEVGGVEKKSLPHLLGSTNLVLHGIDRLTA